MLGIRNNIILKILERIKIMVYVSYWLSTRDRIYADIRYEDSCVEWAW